jgi:hypothetical protein
MRSRDSTFVDRLALVHQKDGFEVSWRAPIGNKTAYLAANHQPRKSQGILTLPAHANGLATLEMKFWGLVGATEFRRGSSHHF